MALDEPCSCPVCFAELEQPEEMHCPGTCLDALAYIAQSSPLMFPALIPHAFESHSRAAGNPHILNTFAALADCGSLEGMELLRSGGSSAKARLFSYDWASGFIAPFRKADLKVARAAIRAVSGWGDAACCFGPFYMATRTYETTTDDAPAEPSTTPTFSILSPPLLIRRPPRSSSLLTESTLRAWLIWAAATRRL